jgi:hypothetical protein
MKIVKEECGTVTEASRKELSLGDIYMQQFTNRLNFSAPIIDFYSFFKTGTAKTAWTPPALWSA